MSKMDFDPGAPWHSPERAWTPLMWIIAAMALSMSAMLLAPLAPVVATSASGAAGGAAVGPDVALADAAKALANWSAAPPDRAASTAADATTGAPRAAH